jgi:hypothetical protein
LQATFHRLLDSCKLLALLGVAMRRIEYYGRLKFLLQNPNSMIPPLLLIGCFSTTLAESEEVCG